MANPQNLLKPKRHRCISGAGATSSTYLNQRYAARRLFVTTQTIRAAWQRGELKGYRVGVRGIRYKVEDLDRWLEAREVKPEEKPEEVTA